jgi:hypothetical protein
MSILKNVFKLISEKRLEELDLILKNVNPIDLFGEENLYFHILKQSLHYTPSEMRFLWETLQHYTFKLPDVDVEIYDVGSHVHLFEYENAFSYNHKYDLDDRNCSKHVHNFLSHFSYFCLPPLCCICKEEPPCSLAAVPTNVFPKILTLQMLTYFDKISEKNVSDHFIQNLRINLDNLNAISQFQQESVFGFKYKREPSAPPLIENMM